MRTSSTIETPGRVDGAAATTSVLVFQGEDVWGLLVVPPATDREDVRCVIHTRDGALDHGDGLAAGRERLRAASSRAGITASANGLLLDVALAVPDAPVGSATGVIAAEWLEATGSVKLGGAQHQVRGRSLRIDVPDPNEGAGCCADETIAVAGTVGGHEICVAKTATSDEVRSFRTDGQRQRAGEASETVEDLQLRLEGGELSSITLDFGGCPVGFYGTPPQDLDAVEQIARLEVSAHHGGRSFDVAAWFVRLRDLEAEVDGHAVVVWARPA